MLSLSLPGRRHALPFAVSVSLALLLGGVPTSSAVTKTATINACQKKKGGALRVVSAKVKCKRTETRLTWNQTGPSGANGSNGTNGERGPSDGWYVADNNFNVDAKSVSLSLPAGIYAVSGSMWAIARTPVPDGNTLAGVDCPVSSPVDTTRFGRTYFNVSGVVGDPVGLSYGAGVANVILVLPSASTVTMTCTKSVGVSVELYQARLQAIALGKLN